MAPDRQFSDPHHHRGATTNPTNRFEEIHYEVDPTVDSDPTDPRPHKTRFLRDLTSTIITYNDSPDVGFNAGINVYRGCEHGCIYCYARPTHEFLGFSAGLDFESVIMVKDQAPALLRTELSKPTWRPQVLGMSGVTDPYQPIERQLKLTRRCLKVLGEFRNPVAIITKNQLVTRDIDYLKPLAELSAVAVFVSLTTLDPDLRTVMEPRTSPPEARLKTIEKLTSNGISVGTLVAPIIPGLTDHEIPAILKKAVDAGAQFAGHVILRLPYGVKDLFQDWLEQHFPDRKAKVLNRLKAIRSGKLNGTEFGDRMKGQGIFADQIHQLFRVSCRKLGIADQRPTLTTEHFRREPNQLSLF